MAESRAGSVRVAETQPVHTPPSRKSNYHNRGDYENELDTAFLGRSGTCSYDDVLRIS
jgi:hypothetical protein